MEAEAPAQVLFKRSDLARELKNAFPGMIPSRKVAADLIETLALIIQGALLAGLAVDLPGVARLKAIPGRATTRRNISGTEWKGVTKGRIKAIISKEMIQGLQGCQARVAKCPRKAEVVING